VPLDIGLWRVDGGVRRLPIAGMPSEERLEDLIEADPGVLGQPLLIVGRQVVTAHGKRIDLLGLDGDGALHILELKRDKTPRDVIAQVLDYGSWVQSLSHDDVLATYSAYRPGEAIEVAFESTFGSSLPEELNTGHWLTIVAADLDAESQRIVEYLASFDLPVNVVFFRYFADGDREYVARTWLIEETEDLGPRSRANRTKEPWNGVDWYVSFGEEANGRSWDDARAFGFVSAGGGNWYTRSLQRVPVGARVWAYIPGTGYVGVGTTTGAAQPLRDSAIATNNLSGTYSHANGEEEWVIPVDWQRTVPRTEAFSEPGLFANQNSACRLRNRFTLDQLYPAFGQGERDRLPAD
jgi:hypothetical protein